MVVSHLLRRAERAVTGPVRVAGIDCGTNTIRLLIADLADDGTLTDVVRQARIVRLGAGVDRIGRLDPAAVQRTLDQCREYARTCRRHRVQALRFVATSATRDAADGPAFLAQVERVFAEQSLTVVPEVLDGPAEARLTYAGATAGLPADLAAPYLVVDLGGGSTELVRGGTRGADGVDAARSLNIGSVRLTERILRSDPPSPGEIDAARALVGRELDDALGEVGLAGVATVVGVAGTVTTLTALALGLDDYDSALVHLARVPLATMRRTCTDLLAMPRGQRAALGCLEPGRVDVIGAGALIWDEVLARVAAAGTATVVTSEHDILDGAAASGMPARPGGSGMPERAAYWGMSP